MPAKVNAGWWHMANAFGLFDENASFSSASTTAAPEPSSPIPAGYVSDWPTNGTWLAAGQEHFKASSPES